MEGTEATCRRRQRPVGGAEALQPDPGVRVLRVMQSGLAKGSRARDVTGLARALNECAVDAFRLELCLFCSFDGTRFTVVDSLGTQAPAGFLADPGQLGAEEGRIFRKGHPFLAGLAPLDLSQAIACAFTDRQGRVRGMLLAGVTAEKADGFGPIPEQLGPAFGILAGHAGAMLLQRELLEQIHDQELRLTHHGEHLANLGRELRAPVNTLLDLSRLALESGLPPPQQEQVRGIRQCGQQVLGLIHDLLTGSRIEAGPATGAPTVFTLETLLGSVTDRVREAARSKGLELRVKRDPKVPVRLVGDPARLRRILVHFASNAVKYTDLGQITLQTWLLEETGQEVRVHFSVQDTGIGIASDQCARLFQGPRQADGSAGLGLTGAKDLAGLMGGEVGVESEPGVGSTFWCTARLGRSPASPRFPACGPRRSLAGAQILVVDDIAVNRQLAKELLEAAGASVALAANGQEALRFLERQRPHLVLMDIQMPVMDGLEASRRIRADGRFESLPILAMTAYSHQEERPRCLAAGMDGHVPKPVDAGQLIELVATHLERSGFACFVTAEPAPPPPGPLEAWLEG